MTSTATHTLPPALASAPVPPLLPTEVESDLREAVRGFLADRADFDTVAAAYEEDPATGSATRDAVDAGLAGELGLFGLLVPEDLGGAGAGIAEAAVVAEEIGRAAAPSRFLSSAVLAATLLVRSGAAEQEPGAGVVTGLVEGSALPVLAYTADRDELHAEVSVSGSAGLPEPGAEVSLTGAVPAVAEAVGASSLLVVTGAGQDTLVLSVPTDATGVTVSGFLTFDMTRPLADVEFTGASATVLAAGPRAARAVGEALLVGRTLLAVEQYGVAQRAFDITLEYVKGRRQFGRTLGSYQALKHRLADLWLAVEQAGAATTYAARQVGTHLEATADGSAGTDTLAEAELTALVAAAYAGEVAVDATEEGVQMHGGNGMTWEYPLHLLLKRAKQDEQLLGLPEQARRDIAPLVGLGV
ncbi:acyl-CoA dehydrogenase family protein [Brevibacterium litoralis]|uniref:acyl-CoA dehydrogenase family protein n=1 Tax=Brevibacterium litoralis TaxID=3138935 RepID=UPI0032ED1DF7